MCCWLRALHLLTMLVLSYFLSSQLQLVLPLKRSLHRLQLRLPALWGIELTWHSDKRKNCTLIRGKQQISATLTRAIQRPPVASDTSCFSMLSRLWEASLCRQMASKPMWTDSRLMDSSCSERGDSAVVTDDDDDDDEVTRLHIWD